MMGFGFVGMTLVLVVAIALAFWSASMLFPGPKAGTEAPRARSPLEIARCRYAAGEITKDEFEAIKRRVT